MSSITFIGLNHKTATTELRERAAFSIAELPDALEHLISLPGVEEAVILSTCNRTELYAAVNNHCDGMAVLSNYLCDYRDIPLKELQAHLYTADDIDAATHLFNVVCSLDSLVLGEQQILGQVRSAYRVANDYHATGKMLNRLFHNALSIGKGVRSETAISTSHVSLATIAVQLVRQVFDDIEKRTVLVLGAGEMSELTARYLADNNVGSIIVSNRTYNRALTIATELGGRAMRFDDITDALSLADIVIASTSAPHFIITPTIVSEARKGRRGHSLIMIDLAIPRDIDPACSDIDDVFLYNMDDLSTIVEGNRAGRELAAQQAARMISEEVDKFASWLEACDATPTIQALRAQAAAVQNTELQHLFKRLKNVDERDRASIEAATTALINKLLHQPTKTLKEQALGTDGALYLRITRELFGIDEPTKSDTEENTTNDTP